VQWMQVRVSLRTLHWLASECEREKGRGRGHSSRVVTCWSLWGSGRWLEARPPRPEHRCRLEGTVPGNGTGLRGPARLWHVCARPGRTARFGLQRHPVHHHPRRQIASLLLCSSVSPELPAPLETATGLWGLVWAYCAYRLLDESVQHACSVRYIAQQLVHLLYPHRLVRLRRPHPRRVRIGTNGELWSCESAATVVDCHNGYTPIRAGHAQPCFDDNPECTAWSAGSNHNPSPLAPWEWRSSEM
jgi:hypothetical protein